MFIKQKLSKSFDKGANASASKINEVGDTVKGQKQLGKLAGKRIKQCWYCDEVGDTEKADDYGKRYSEAYKKAHDERTKTDSSKQRSKMNKAFHKAAQKQASVKESVNEVGDTYKGQEKLGRLSGKRAAQASQALKNSSKSTDYAEKEKYDSQASDFTNRSTNAYVKARDERNAKGNSWEPHQQQMASAFNDGEKHGYSKFKKKFDRDKK